MKKSLLFLLFITYSALFAQLPNNCVNMVNICGDSEIKYDVSGYGTQELNGNNSCDSQENNSIWLKVSIAQAGTLGFILTPESTAITEDYDFFIFGPNVSCSSLGFAIRCSTTNPQAAGATNNLTGMNDSETDTSEGPGPSGNSFVKSLNVNAGETYFIVIDRPHGNSAFNLQWTGTAKFYDAPKDQTPTGYALDLMECDTNGDGKSYFDLDTHISSIVGTQNVDVSYHNTFSDASLNLNPINPTAYYTGSQSIYIRLADKVNGCFTVVDFKLIVLNDLTIPNPPPLYFCVNDPNSSIPIDLTVQDNLLTGGNPDYIVTYHLSENDLENKINPITNPYINSSNPQTIWARVESLTNGCFGVASFSVELIKIPIVYNPANILQCDPDSNGFYTFDLSSLEAGILGGQSASDYEVSFYLSQTDADLGQNAVPKSFTNSSAYQQETIYVRVQHHIATQCYTTGSFSVDVFDTPLVNILPDLILCDDTASGSDTDGQAVFDLSVQNSVALGSQNPSQFAITYHLSQTDADAQTNPLSLTYTNLSTLQTIYVRMENVDHTDCYATSSFNLVVNPLPVLTAASVQLEQCDDDTDGFAAFNLTEANSLLSVNYLQETFTYYPTQNDALSQTHVIANPTAYVNPTVTTASVWTEVTNALGCSRIKEVTLQVVTTQIPIATLITLTQCDDFAVDNDDTNGITAFDLTQAQIQIAALFPNPQDLNITFYQNISDALAEQNEITDLQNYRNETAPFIQLLTVRVDNKYYNACVGLGEHVTLNVSSTPQFDIVNPGVVCLNESPVTLSATTDGKRYDYLWSDDQYNPLGIDPTLDITQGGTYHLTLTIQGSTGCDKTKSITVEESQESLLTTQDLDYSQFQYNNTLTIPTGTQYGIGDYQYALDPNGTFTAEPYFEGLTGGSYILYIEDLKGCRLHQVPFTILEYMRFFTPNADGYNDTWNLLGADLAPDAEIQIFDRYGKLLATVNPLGNGWDGTYNGQPMPSTDYWFTIKLSDGTTHKGHFSLIRR